mmetsp:Transcript_21990/g.83671  ORF Transcript_21990/g.83671 Transcript_21990/m.83671 type:complete len:228 (+) Transcript_21990:1200-1883(+)
MQCRPRARQRSPPPPRERQARRLEPQLLLARRKRRCRPQWPQRRKRAGQHKRRRQQLAGAKPPQIDQKRRRGRRRGLPRAPMQPATRLPRQRPPPRLPKRGRGTCWRQGPQLHRRVLWLRTGRTRRRRLSQQQPWPRPRLLEQSGPPRRLHARRATPDDALQGVRVRCLLQSACGPSWRPGTSSRQQLRVQRPQADAVAPRLGPAAGAAALGRPWLPLALTWPAWAT